MRCSPIMLLLLTSAVFAQNKVETIGGREYFGQILRNDTDTMVLQLDDSSLICIPKSSIVSLHYNIQKLRDSNYWSAGVALGTPAGGQLLASYDFSDYGVRLSLGAVDDIFGAQINVYRKLVRKEFFSHEISAVLGLTNEEYVGLFDEYYSIRYREMYFAGLTYAAHWYGFFAEVGLVGGYRVRFRPQIALQLGYMHEFR